jgi:quercetin dioxygenase-like cupin family protein
MGLMKGIFLIVIGSILIFTSTCLAEGLTLQYNTILFQSNIDQKDGSEVLIREAFFPVGWRAPRHYHNGNLFIYVIEGEFEVTLEGEETRVYLQGQALQMKARTRMDARNPSPTKSLKLAVFQVGKPNAPFVVPIE